VAVIVRAVLNAGITTETSVSSISLQLSFVAYGAPILHTHSLIKGLA
jgi:hypothetical protein